jgi:hypothetical protein
VRGWRAGRPDGGRGRRDPACGSPVAATRPQSIDYLFFLPLGKEKNATADARITYNFLTSIYAGLTALNTPASQNFMNDYHRGSP